MMTIAISAMSESFRGCLETVLAQRCQREFVTIGSGPLAASERRSRRLKTWSPWKPKRAGNKVNEASIVINTVNDAAMATPFKNESCKTSIPRSAMHTVEPAKSTARPEVLIAVTIASLDSSRVSIPVEIASR